MKFCGQCGAHLARLCPVCGFANPPVHRFCGQCGTPLSEEPIPAQAAPLSVETPPEPSIQPAPPSLAGERRLASVILADVPGSTDLLEQIGTEAWVGIMNRLLQILESQVYCFGGEVDQFRGDGLVAFFGATSAYEDDPERAVLAALAMQQAIKPYAAELIEREGIHLRLRVGVNTGEVIVASIGDSRQHSEETAMGEAIALAARMESAAEPGTVLVSENTYRMVSEQFDWQPLGEIVVKGLSLPIAVYRPLAPRADANQPHRLQAYGLSVPLIGREAEFDTLNDSLEDLRAGRGGIVMVTGDVGLGKSRLVTEVRQHINRDQALLAGTGGNDRDTTISPGSLTWLQGRCRSYDQWFPYSMWLDLLWNWLGAPEEESQVEKRDHLRRLAADLWGDQLDEHYPYLASILSLPLEGAHAELVNRLDAEWLRHQFFLTVRSWVEAMAKRGPLVLVLADLHWADTTSLDLLEYCLPLCDHEALLWLLVFRPERTSPVWKLHHHIETEYPHRATTLALAPLSVSQSGEFIDRLVGPEALPKKTRTLILDKAGGNPYYLEEFIHSLVEQEALVQDAQTGQWRVTRAVDSLRLPDTLQNLLLARIDRLSPDERPVLQMAAVIGSVFWSNVLGAMAGNGIALKGRLTALQRAQLVIERGRLPELGMEYAFKSTLIRDAAYESVLKAQRATYHRQAADYLEGLVSEKSLAQYHDILAHHYHHAGAHRKELFHVLLAAKGAQRIYANTEAIEHYTRALELLDQLEGPHVPPLGESGKDWRLEALRGLGEIHFGTGKVAQAEKYFQEAISLGQEMELNPQELVRLYYWLGEVLFWQDRYKERISIGEEGLTLLGDDTESVEAALMNQTIAIGHLGEGNREKFSEFTYRTAQFIQSLPYSPELRPAYDHIIFAHQGDKNLEQAMKWVQALERNAEQYHDLRASGEVHLYTANILNARGDLRGAISRLEQALDLFRRIGDTKHESWCLRDMGRTFLSLGDLRKAVNYTGDGLKTTEAVGNKGEIARMNLQIGIIFLCQGLWEKAVDAYQKADQLIRETGTWIWIVKAWADYSIGHVRLSQGEPAEALKKFKVIARAGSKILMQYPYDFASILSGLDEAYQDPEEFRAFCRRFREEHPEAGDSPFIQWFLEPSDVEAVGKLLYDDEFADSLSSDWVWRDPFGDCSLRVQEGLEIHAANGRNLRHINLSAPRLLRSVSGNFAVQTVCGPVSGEKPAIGGLLLWKDGQNWLRLDRGEHGRHEITFVRCLGNKDVIVGRGRLPSVRVILRLERFGRGVRALCSVDGVEWFTAGQIEFSIDDPVEVGLHAIGDMDRSIYPGAYPDGTAIRFESFQLWDV